jgi:hypothetical protein
LRFGSPPSGRLCSTSAAPRAVLGIVAGESPPESHAAPNRPRWTYRRNRPLRAAGAMGVQRAIVRLSPAVEITKPELAKIANKVTQTANPTPETADIAYVAQVEAEIAEAGL